MKKSSVTRWISVLLSLLFLFHGAAAAFAADDDPTQDPPAEEVTEEIAEDTVARIYICSRKNTWIGHVFVYLENVSEEPLMIGVYELPPQEGVSVGSYGFTKSDGLGIYINMEAYIYNTYGDENIICLSDELTKEEVEKFSHRLLYSNTWDFMFFNCASFAFMMWNSVASPFLMPLLFPMFGRLEIRMYGGEAPPRFFYPGEDRVYRLRGTGNNCRLEPVSAKSLEK